MSGAIDILQARSKAHMRCERCELFSWVSLRIYSGRASWTGDLLLGNAHFLRSQGGDASAITDLTMRARWRGNAFVVFVMGPCV